MVVEDILLPSSVLGLSCDIKLLHYKKNLGYVLEYLGLHFSILERDPKCFVAIPYGYQN